MDIFLKKKRKLDTAEETLGLRQSVEAAATASDAARSKLPRNDGINLQLKVRQYCENYIALGFTWTGNQGCSSPLCTISGKKLANSAMAPAKLKRHLATKHPELSGKKEQYFKRELAFNKREVSMFAKKFKLSDKGQEASYAVAEIVARKMNSHTISETVILPTCHTQKYDDLSRVYKLKEELLTFYLQENLKDFVECLSDDHWCSKVAYFADIFHELNLLNNGMQGRNENILSSTDKINDFQKKLTIWKKRIAGGNLEMFPSVFKRNCQETALLILNHLHTLLTNLDKYFPSISVDQYDWIRNPLVEFETFEEQLTLTEEEELASVLNGRTLELKHSELHLNAFWLLVEKEYPAIAQKALRLVVHVSTYYFCEFGFSALATIKHKKRAQLLSLEDELHVFLSKTRPSLKELCKKHQAQVSH
ncbi:Hypothetical predicted protein [Octopus vulgaris]|uniref:Zinc finger BED domain-containing protein 5-like n=1 Tax=Octopus vulgaris TaxID=6645 RepID=A0AA36FAW4_OCTVU|nr:Hypothetical predicted protein [Octopus vulgaris]